MNIIWNIETILESIGDTERVKVAPQDLWEDVKLSQVNLSHLAGNYTVDITKNNVMFKNIPTHWYMIEN